MSAQCYRRSAASARGSPRTPLGLVQLRDSRPDLECFAETATLFVAVGGESLIVVRPSPDLVAKEPRDCGSCRSSDDAFPRTLSERAASPAVPYGAASQTGAGVRILRT